MAEEVKPKEETGGVVTTVKAATTQDQDVIARLKAQADENDAEKAAAKADADKAAAAAEKADDKAPAKAKSVDDDDNDTLDFKSLSPAQQKAVAKLYKDRRQEKRETKKLLEKMEALEARIADKQTGPAPVAERKQESGRPRRPRPEDFDKTESYDEAVEQYEDDLHDFRLKKESRELQDQAALEDDNKVVKIFNKAARAFAEEHEDYEEVMEDSEAPLSPKMFGAVLEHGPVLGYYFAKHPKESGRISEMMDKEADKAIMRIVLKIEDETTATDPQKVPGAPPNKPDPPNPTQGRGSAGTVVKDRSQMTFKEREKELAKRSPGMFTYDV